MNIGHSRNLLTVPNLKDIGNLPLINLLRVHRNSFKNTFTPIK